MANNTIYPYGTGGSLPSSIGIVNDLTTGGADKALSAAMGKKLMNDGRYADQLNAIKNTAFPSGNTSWFGSSFGKGVNILHFSDIHGDGTNLARIVTFLSGTSGLTALHTGDIVNEQWSSDFNFWGTAGADNILNCIGNHDSKYSNNWSGKTAAECYTRYFAPYISGWGVTYTADVCYYYKDWSDKNVRLIVLDVQHWDTTQKEWLEATLASAKTAGYHVVCAGHCTPASSDSNGTRTCPFDTLGANRSKLEGNSYGTMNSQAPAAVQDFIDAGGHFVCWLTGHTHADMFRHLSSYPHQLYCAVACAGMNANVSSGASCQIVRELGEKSQDLFNLVSVNATRQTVTFVRVGADRDTIGRHIGTVVYDYANNEIIWND